MLLGAAAVLGVAALLGAVDGVVGRPTVGLLRGPGSAAACAVLALLCAGVALILRRRRAPGALPRPDGTDLRVVAHELRAPLTVAVAHLDTARTPRRDPDLVLADVAQASRAIDRTEALLHHLVDGPDVAGRHEEETALLDVVSEAALDFAALASRRGLSVSVQCEPDTDTRVHGDPVQLRQLVDNVLSNAVKYAEEDGWVDVALTSDDDTVTLEVANPGTTLDPSEAGGIFASRVRGSGAELRAEGHGVGLAVVESVAAAHGGSAAMLVDAVAQTTLLRVSVTRFHPGFHP